MTPQNLESMEDHHLSPKELIAEKDRQIKDLEEMIRDQEKARKRVNEKLSQILDRLEEIRLEKKVLQEKLNDLEHKDLDYKLQKHHELLNAYHKMSHRSQVTKELLDDARRELRFLRKVIKDMEERGLMDYIKKRYPESFQEYKNRR